MQESERAWVQRYFFVLVAGMLVHSILAVLTPVSGDEMYYWDCARHPDWSYFDQPPAVIWSVIPFRLLLGDVRLAVRAPAILASLLLGLFLYVLLAWIPYFGWVVAVLVNAVGLGAAWLAYRDRGLSTTEETETVEEMEESKTE